MGSNTSISIDKQQVPIAIKTNYPWDGQVQLTVSPQKKTRFALHMRIPGWAEGNAAPGGLYQFQDNTAAKFTVQLNGKDVPYKIEKGYTVIDREWKNGDQITLTLPMEIKRVVSRPEVKADSGRVALQRGPIIYCIEGADNNGKAWNIILPQNASLSAIPYTVISESVIAIQSEVPAINISQDGLSVHTEQKKITAIPYYTWSNRGQGPMQVWLPERISNVKISQ